jgi:predicted amino acid dehydrogenase
VSAGTGTAAVAADRGARALGGGDKVRVAIVGATGYVGAELIRLLALHPHVEIHGLVGRERKGDPIAHIHPSLATRDLEVWDHVPDDAEAVFLALPHGTVAVRAQEFLDRGQTIIDHTPMKRFGVPEDLLGALLWLFSPGAEFVTGAVIPVDGGFSAFSGV